MTKLIITLSIILTGLLCKAQVSEQIQVGNYTQIEVANGIDLFYEQNETHQDIRVEGISAEELKSIQIENSKGVLKINTAKGTKNSSRAKVFITGNSLISIVGKSKAHIIFQNTVNVSNLTLTLSNEATFKGSVKATDQIFLNMGSKTVFNGRIETDTFIGTFKNNSKVNLSGIAKEASIISKSKSYCNAKNFIVQNTEIQSNNSTVLITTQNKIAIDLKENAKLTYFGMPKNVDLKDGFIIGKEKNEIPTSLLAIK